MIWPPRSPDLNPIEKLWDKLDRKVCTMAPTNVQSLWKCLGDAWRKLNCETMEKLVLECQIYVKLSYMVTSSIQLADASFYYLPKLFI